MTTLIRHLRRHQISPPLGNRMSQVVHVYHAVQTASSGLVNIGEFITFTRYEQVSYTVRRNRRYASFCSMQLLSKQLPFAIMVGYHFVSLILSIQVQYGQLLASFSLVDSVPIKKTVLKFISSVNWEQIMIKTVNFLS